MVDPNYSHLKPPVQPAPVPDRAGNLVTLVDRCWVCNRKFREYGGNFQDAQEFHHIIPRAYGGNDGPTVSLCSAHHTLLHAIALKLIAERPFHELLTGDALHDRRLLWLATRVQVSHASFSDDPNKRLVLVASITKEEASMMNDLYSKYGVRSRESLVHFLIKEAHDRHFPKRRRRA